VDVNPTLAKILPRATERLRSLARGLPAAMARDPAAAQQALLELMGGPIVLKALAGGGVEAHVPLAAARNLLNGKANIE
jgi:hypothetical protein